MWRAQRRTKHVTEWKKVKEMLSFVGHLCPGGTAHGEANSCVDFVENFPPKHRRKKTAGVSRGRGFVLRWCGFLHLGWKPSCRRFSKVSTCRSDVNLATSAALVSSPAGSLTARRLPPKSTRWNSTFPPVFMMRGICRNCWILQL